MVVGLLGVGAVVVTLVLVVSFAASQSPTVPGPTVGSPPGGGFSVKVSEVEVTSSGDVCGSQGLTASGYDGYVDTAFQVSFVLPGDGSSVPCTVSSVSAVTADFSVSAVVPETVTSDVTPFTVSVTAEAAYAGTLVLAFA
ncbi:MAG TPA: hypothetical protein VMG99_01140 [Thermoplasmata archaeon]|nr:hypothetical protein [Thermoplasmata archaeon]